MERFWALRLSHWARSALPFIRSKMRTEKTAHSCTSTLRSEGARPEALATHGQIDCGGFHERFANAIVSGFGSRSPGSAHFRPESTDQATTTSCPTGSQNCAGRGAAFHSIQAILTRRKSAHPETLCALARFRCFRRNGCDWFAGHWYRRPSHPATLARHTEFHSPHCGHRGNGAICA